jgi:hypothetical protein
MGLGIDAGDDRREHGLRRARVEAGVVVVGPALGGDRVGVEEDPRPGAPCRSGGSPRPGAAGGLVAVEVDLPRLGRPQPTRWESRVDLPPLRPIQGQHLAARTCTSTPRSATTGP